MGSDTRATKYSKAVEIALKKAGHASNAELLTILRHSFPELSATTVHRVTARLAERGLIGVAPPTADGSMRYDANVVSHDHFICQGCANIRDLHVAPTLIPQIEAALGGCRISGRLTVSGICAHCLKKNNNPNRKENI
ncbi:MAG TPA: transcriptional repressor [Candidatus Saccharimonadales bacterium]|nr:transcriptional repressor [Candidatus Saccharimonadales bacterium]